MDNKLKWFSVGLIILMALDIISTSYLLNNGMGKEGNPVLKGVSENVLLLLGIKFIGTLIIISVLGWAINKNRSVTMHGMRLITVIMLFVVVNNICVGIASAETGSISLYTATVPSSYTITGSQDSDSSTWDKSRFYFDYVTFTGFTEIVTTGGWSFGSKETDSTTFNITSGGSGSGIVTYEKSKNTVTWYGTNVAITGGTVSISYASDIFTGMVSRSAVYIPTAGVTAANPFCLARLYNGCITHTNSPTYDVVVFNAVGAWYNINYFNLGETQYFNGSIYSKYGSSKVSFINNSFNEYYIDSSYNTLSTYNIIRPYGEALLIKLQTSTGQEKIQSINSTIVGVTPTPTPTINPITGAGIIFDQDDYSVGDIANITWSRIINTPFGDTDFIVAIHPDGTEEELISSPPDTGNYKVLMSPAGTWKVEFRRSSWLFGVSVLDSDTSTVGAETPSYIYAPVNVATGKLFNVTYRIGFTPTANAWIKTYRWIGSDWVYEQAFSAIGAKNVETNTSILIKDTGKYLIKLCDVIQGCKASTSTTGYFNGTAPTLNITVSNITTDKAAYSYGEYIATNVYVDNSNWSNKAISVDYFNYATGITNNQQYVQSQIESFNLYVSDLVFPASGNSALRLIGKNDTGTYVLAFKNFTLSSLDAEGYGLSVIGNPTCKGSTGQIKVVVPAGEVANLSISADNAIYNKEYVMNGSKIVPYTFSISGAYYVTLRVNGEAKRLIIVNIGDCTVPVNTTWQGQGKIENSCSFWDGWVGNLAGGQGVNDLTRFMFALLVIGMITAFTTIITKNLGAGIITGFFPYAFFVFISLSTPCGQYMPVWTAVFIALIVGVKMRWF